MAVDMFLVLTDITGETQDDKVSGDGGMDVLAWSWGSSQSGTTHMGSGAGSGKADFQDINVTKYVDSASTALLQYLTTGKHIPDGKIIVRKAGGEQHDYITIEMTDIIVSSISSGGSGGEDRLTENVSLNFGAFAYQYNEQGADGSVTAGTPFTYDIAANLEG